MEKKLSFIGLNNFTIDDVGVIRKYVGEKCVKSYRGKANDKGYVVWFYAHKGYLIHRLVATAFIPNPNNLPTVNHKDGDKDRNWADNLEWATQRDNNLHSFYTLGNKVVGVEMYTLTGDYLREFDSYEMAQTYLGRPGKKGVWEACNNFKKRPKGTAYGFLWKKKQK